MIDGIHHVSLATGNMDRLLGFYRDLLGLATVWDTQLQHTSEAFDAIVGLADARFRNVTLRAGNAFIEIFEYRSPPAREPAHEAAPNDVGLRHICFNVVDVLGEFERMRAAGVRFNGPPQELAGVRTVYARDPDGNFVEFQEILPGSNVPRISV